MEFCRKNPIWIVNPYDPYGLRFIHISDPYEPYGSDPYGQKKLNPPFTETKQQEEEEHRFSHIHSFKQQEATTTRTSFIQTTIIQNKKQWQWEERN